MDFNEMANRVKKYLPLNVHKKIDELFKNLEECSNRTKNHHEDLIDKPLLEIVNNLEDGSLKPIPMMRKLQTLDQWASAINQCLNNGYDEENFKDPNLIKKIWFSFLSESSAGHKVKMEELVKNASCELDLREEPKFRDITSSNLIVELSELVTSVEESFEKEIPNSSVLLKEGKYHEIDFSIFTVNSDYANKLIETGVTTKINLRNFILDKKEELLRGLELYKIFSPILKEFHVLISLMPVILTMLYEDKDGLEKIREDCNNIFMELSIGADLERITLSLREKLGKKREIEDIRVNAEAIEKLLKKIKDALNFNIFSNLRRLKIQTIIEDELFNNAAEIGLSLTGLNTTFGIREAPKEYKDMILESTRFFSESMVNIKKLIAPRLPEEIGIAEKPNLTSLNKFLLSNESEIEKYYMMIPSHIGPIYSGSVLFCAETINSLANKLIILKEKVLKQIFINEDHQKAFYSIIKTGIQELEKNFLNFKEYFSFGLKLTNVDQGIALAFSENGDNEQYYKTQYELIFEDSIRNIKRMLAMKTLNQDDANSLMVKITAIKKTIIEFTAKHNLEDIRRILGKGRNFKEVIDLKKC